MNFRLIIASTVAALVVAPAAATAQSTNSVSSANNQQNSGSVVLNPSGGTQVNNNVNNAYSSTYSFGPGISCPTTSLAINAYGGGSDAYGGGSGSGSNSYGGSVSLIVPLGEEIGTACRELAQEITRQRQLDTDVNMIKVCANLAQSGIVVDVSRFPQFEVCSAVSSGGKTAVTTGRVFTPEDNSITVVPVR